MADPIFHHNVRPVQIADLVFNLCFITDLDEALDYYIKNSPSDTDKIPYFTRLWESAESLARYIAAHRNDFAGKHVLEFGCGLGLPSFCAGKCGASHVTASDFHPDCKDFFLKNAELNHLDNIDFHLMDWREPDLDDKFDIIIGSDLIYEKNFVDDLAKCVVKYLKSDGMFIYADPGRTALQTLSSNLEKAGYNCQIIADGTIWILLFKR